MEKGYTREMMEKARTAKSAEDLLSFAEEYDYPLTEEEAKAYFEQISKGGELSDSELENVAGGGCGYKAPVTELDWCEQFICVDCGHNRFSCTCSGVALGHLHCGKCKYVRYKSCRWWCTNPKSNM